MQFSKSVVLAVGASVMTLAMANTAEAQFIRQQGQPAVYYQHSNTHYCQVQNGDQMIAYGGFSQVRVTGNIDLKGEYTGFCGWTNGFFRRSNEPKVYMMYGNSSIPKLGDKYCHVKDENQLGKLANKTGYPVNVVEPTSDFEVGRTYTGTCE